MTGKCLSEARRMICVTVRLQAVSPRLGQAKRGTHGTSLMKCGHLALRQIDPVG